MSIYACQNCEHWRLRVRGPAILSCHICGAFDWAPEPDEGMAPSTSDLDKSFHHALRSSVTIVPDPRDSELTSLRAERDALIEALRPFAEYAECKCDCCNHDEDVIAGPVTNDWNFKRVIKMGDLRKALSVLKGK